MGMLQEPLSKSIPEVKERERQIYRSSWKMFVGRCDYIEMRIRKFAKRARQYLIAYHATDSVQVNAIYSQSDRHGPVAVEKLIGKFRTLRCAMDFDFKFVISIDNDD